MVGLASYPVVFLFLKTPFRFPPCLLVPRPIVIWNVSGSLWFSLLGFPT